MGVQFPAYQNQNTLIEQSINTLIEQSPLEVLAITPMGALSVLGIFAVHDHLKLILCINL